MNPFQIVYRQNPSGVLELIYIPGIRRLSIQAIDMVDYLHDIHEQVKQIISNNKAKYKALVYTHYRRVVFEVGDLVQVVLTYDMFLVGEYKKLKERKIGPCEVFKKINDNAYKICLPHHLKTSDVFNV